MRKGDVYKVLYNLYIMAVIVAAATVSYIYDVFSSFPAFITDPLFLFLIALTVLSLIVEGFNEGIGYSLNIVTSILALVLVSLEFALGLVLVNVLFYPVTRYIIHKKPFTSYELVKPLFNVAQSIIVIWILSRVMLIFVLPFDGYYAVASLILLVMIYIVINVLLVTTVVSLEKKALYVSYFFKPSTYVQMLFWIIVTIYSYYAYIDRGLPGLIFVSFMFVPIQIAIGIYHRFHQLNMALIHDSLTGVYNYYYFFRTIEEFIAKKVPFTLIFIDLDKFKQVNDQYGHSAGNEVLRALAKKVRGIVREENIMFRFGGDEFCIVIQGLVNSQAIIKRIKDKTANFRVSFGGDDIPCSFSMGPYIYEGKTDTTFEKVLEKADREMYIEKKEKYSS